MTTRGDCQGHEPSTSEPQGVTVYCDGSCRPRRMKDMDAVIRGHQALHDHDLKMARAARVKP